MKQKSKIGLLPLFLELYDRVLDSEKCSEMRDFIGIIEREYQARGVETVPASACRTEDEFAAAVSRFEAEKVDAIVTLHLAYSPSLQAIDALAGTELPIIMLDTTPDVNFGFDQSEDRILFNHGIHGVQDLCNLLIRRGKPFVLEAGHWKESDVIDRTCSSLKGFCAAAAFHHQRVGLLGSPFEGMGDFAVPFDLLEKRFGIKVVPMDSETLAKQMPALDSDAVRTEAEADLVRFDSHELSPETLAKSEAAGLALRQWIEQEKLTAITMNFNDITGAPGLPVVPFLEASKAMARGIGYGGEGDVLTAAFCSAIAQVVPATTFTEMFCPDWNGNRIFMSHMGEMNIALTAQKPVLSLRPYTLSDADEPVVATGCLTAGNALLLNLAPGPDNSFTLVTVPVEVCETGGDETIQNALRGWITPHMEIRECLERYSRVGGTHHSVLCYDVDQRFAQAIAQVMDWRFEWIDK